MEPIFLIVEGSVSSDPERQAEYDRCLEINRTSGLFEEVLVVDGRPTFSQHFEMASWLNGIVVLANADISFDKTILLARERLRPREVWALTRWNDGVFYNVAWNTNDVWVFRPPILCEANWGLGMGGCDDCLNFALQQDGYIVTNPSLSVITHHHHKSQVRTWRQRPKLVGPTLHAKPSRLMDLQTLCDRTFLVNLARRPDRLDRATKALQSVGISAEVVQAIDARDTPHDSMDRLYRSPGSRAFAQTLFGIIQKCRKEGASSFLLFQDDVVFHPDFNSRIRDIALPNDWDMFYLGGYHTQDPEDVGSGLVKGRAVYDMHAVSIRSTMFDGIEDVLTKQYEWGATACDIRISFLHEFCKAYVALPNLAWQRMEKSDIQNRTAAYCNYDDAGNHVSPPRVAR